MADILSQEEIDALLQAVDDDEDGAELVASEAHKNPVYQSGAGSYIVE